MNREDQSLKRLHTFGGQEWDDELIKRFFRVGATPVPDQVAIGLGYEIREGFVAFALKWGGKRLRFAEIKDGKLIEDYEWLESPPPL